LFDFRSFCDSQGIPNITAGEHHHASHGWINTHCPFCNSLNWQLGFNLETGHFSCWVCGGHSVVETVQKLSRGASFHSAKQTVEEFQVAGGAGRSHIRKRNDILKAPVGLEPLPAAHRQYLKERQYDPQHLCNMWDAQGIANVANKWRWRICVPIYDQNGKAVAYTGRTISKIASPRWLTSSKEELRGDPRAMLYGVHKVPNDTILIVEGPGDVWRLGPGAVATLGTDWSQEQGQILRGYARRFIMFDPEKKAQQQATKLANWLSGFPGQTSIITNIDSDPGGMDDKTVRQLRKEIRM